MENASSALIMAGKLLLVLLLLSLLAFVYGNATNFYIAKDNQDNTDKLKAWNDTWEMYNKRALYGAEVKTVWNKAKQNNSESEFKVTVIVYGNKGQALKEADINNKDVFKVRDIYECTKMERSSDGRINYIEFKYKE